MDCLTARQTFEVARPGSADSALSELPQGELAQAAEHVRSCADCQSVLRSREALDRRIGRLCRDVPVPAGLKERLLEGLRAAQAESAGSLAIHPAAVAVAETRPAAAHHVRHVSRRAALRIALAAAGVLLMAGGVWFWTSGPSATVALDDVERQVIGLPGNSSALPEFTGFAGGTALVLPQRMTVPKSLAQAAPRQLAVNGDELAVYFFKIPRGDTQPPLEGRLIVFPRAMLKKTAAGPGLLNGSVGYAGGFAKAGWVEGPLVYICYLRGGKDQHRQLEELLLPYVAS